MIVRHVVGSLLGILVTAVLLGGGGWAVRQAQAGAGAVPLGGQPVWPALGAMAVVGLVIGSVVAGRVSPLAAFVPSTVLLAWSVVYALDMDRALALVPRGPAVSALFREAGAGNQWLLASGVHALLGTLLFLPVLMPSRWVREEEPARERERSY